MSSPQRQKKLSARRFVLYPSIRVQDKPFYELGDVLPEEWINLKLESAGNPDERLVFCASGDKVVSQIVTADLKAVAQIPYGDMLMGAAPDSVWIFVGSSNAFVATSCLGNWYSRLEETLFERHPQIERLEAFVANPPAKFSKQAWYLRFFPAIAQPIAQELDSATAWQFLREVDAQKVDTFTPWG